MSNLLNIFKHFNFNKKQIYTILGAAVLFLLGITLIILDIKNALRPNNISNDSQKVILSRVNTPNTSSTSSQAPNSTTTNKQQPYYLSDSSFIDKTNIDSENARSILLTLSNFFEYLNNKDYNKVLKLLHPYFVNKNNITLSSVQNYFQKEYPTRISYKIDYIDIEKPNFYHVRVIVSDMDLPLNDFRANYYFEYVGGSFRISIPHMVQPQ
jgi:hypothetical protein